MDNCHPYVARVSDGGTNNFPFTGLVRAKARKWDVEFLVKSRTMLIGDVMYQHIQGYRDDSEIIQRVYLQRVTEMEFDMLEAFDVPCMSGTKFVKTYMGCSQSLINDNGITVYMSSRQIGDDNAAMITGDDYWR